MIGDGHAPVARWRALTVRNIDAWYETFKVSDGQKLFLKPEARVKICKAQRAFATMKTPAIGRRSSVCFWPKAANHLLRRRGQFLRAQEAIVVGVLLAEALSASRARCSTRVSLAPLPPGCSSGDSTPSRSRSIASKA